MFSRAELPHYCAMIDELHRRGVGPAVTLHHLTYSRWFTFGGGFSRPDAAERFEEHVDFVNEILHGVDWIVTINDPNISALLARVAARSAAGEKSSNDVPATAQMSLAGGTDPALALQLAAMHAPPVRCRGRRPLRRSDGH